MSWCSLAFSAWFGLESGKATCHKRTPSRLDDSQVKTLEVS